MRLWLQVDGPTRRAMYPVFNDFEWMIGVSREAAWVGKLTAITQRFMLTANDRRGFPQGRRRIVKGGVRS